jgi:hypothetical protein
MAMRTCSAWLAAVLVLCGTAAAQTPARPDLSGIWQKAGGGPGLIQTEPPMTEWGREKFNAAKPIHGPRTVSPEESTAAEMKCLPMGIPGVYFRPRSFEIVQLANRAIMLFEVDHLWRVIHMDGRRFPEVPLHTWMGYSIGRYEGDALVIETRHFIGWAENAHRWVDRLGHPFSDELKVTERFRRTSPTTMVNEITIEDPVAYTKPWTATMNYRLQEKGFEIGEFVCQELMLSELPFNKLTP